MHWKMYVTGVISYKLVKYKTDGWIQIILWHIFYLCLLLSEYRIAHMY